MKKQLMVSPDVRKRVQAFKLKFKSAPTHIQEFRLNLEEELDAGGGVALHNRYVDLDFIIENFPSNEIEIQISKNKKLKDIYLKYKNGDSYEEINPFYNAIMNLKGKKLKPKSK